MELEGQPPIVVVRHAIPVIADLQLSIRAATQMLILSLIQIAVGVICAILGLALIPLYTIDGESVSQTARQGFGIWIGTAFAVTGIVGVATATHNTRRMIITTMVFNIISSGAFCTVLIFYTLPDLMSSSYSGPRQSPVTVSISNAVVAINIVMIVVSVLELVLTIWCAALCCGAVCCCYKSASASQFIPRTYTSDQIQYSGHPPPNVVSQPDEHVNELKPSSAKQILILSSIQIAVGAICMILGIVLVSLVNFQSAFYGGGIWLGALFIGTGALGVGAAKRNNGRMITRCMIFNILCTSIWATNLIGFSMTPAGASSFGRCAYYIGGYMCPSTSYLVISSAMLLMAIAEFIITIWCAALCCGAVCICCYQSSLPPAMQTPNYQDQVMNYRDQVMNYQLGAVPQAAQVQHARHIIEDQQSTGYMSPPAQPNQQASYTTSPAQPGQLVGHMTSPVQPGQQAVHMSPHSQPGQLAGHMTSPAQLGQLAGYVENSQPPSSHPATHTDEPISTDNQDFYQSPHEADTDMLLV